MMTATIIPQIPRIPAMTTGTTDFIISSGLRTPIEQIPTPALALPQAAPRLAKMSAEATPIYPKKYWGQQAVVQSVMVELIQYYHESESDQQLVHLNNAELILIFQMNYEYNNSKILEQQDQHNQSLNSQQLEQQARSLEEEIELTIYNYESLLQMEKKNSADRSEFLLFLIQSTRTRHQEELEALKTQLEAAVAEKQEAQSLEKQMESIGQGVDSIVEEGKKLKQQNQSLQRELQEQQSREKQLDEEIGGCQKELQGYRQKIDEWQRTKIKWNRRKKELLELITDAEKHINVGRLQSMNEQEAEQEDEPMSGLYNKYKGAKSS